MIGMFGQRGTIRILQNDVVALQAQAVALGDRLAALSAQLAAESERSAIAEAEVTRSMERIVELETIVAKQAEALHAQAGGMEALRDDSERQDERIGQVRGDVARIERQAAIDLEEMRRTNTAVAASVLLARARGAG